MEKNVKELSMKELRAVSGGQEYFCAPDKKVVCDKYGKTDMTFLTESFTSKDCIDKYKCNTCGNIMSIPYDPDAWAYNPFKLFRRRSKTIVGSS